MQPNLRILVLPLALGLGLTTPLLAAQAGEHAMVNGHLEGGYEHDSNVTVDELDNSSGKSGRAWVFDAGLEGVLTPGRALNLTLGYSLSGRRYQNLDQFDQNIHLLSADLSYDFEPVTVGTSYHYSDATLGSEPLLDYRRASVYLGTLMGECVYLMASLQSKHKDFDDSDARDADIHGVSLDSFLFFNQSGSHLLLGLDGSRENAEANAYDNDLLRVRVALVHKFALAGEENRLRLGWRYESREYKKVNISGPEPSFINPLTGRLTERSTSERADRAWVLESSWRVGLSDIVSLEPSISQGVYRSDVDAADYSKTVARVALRAEF